jgi:serine/threonine-protein kinase
MATTAFGACTDFVAHLRECNLLKPADLEKVKSYTAAFPHKGDAELAEFLVAQKVLTRFQADAALEGQARELTLVQYTLVDQLGSGSMGTVYKARVTDRDAWYAVKIVPRRNTVGLGTVAEKVKALKDVRHPRVSALVHIGASGERVYLVWPYLEGGEKLDTFVQRQGKLTPRQAVQVALQVASGLQAYHQHGLFHGLLKPTDVLIGSDKRIRILDFGVGFLLTSERGKSLLDTMTNTKTLARGLDCASPESILNPLDRTPAGDQYSLGCILYYCLAGHFPFTYDNPVKKMLAHQAEEPKPIREINPEVSKGLAAIVGRLMRKKPEERYSSTNEVVEALQALTAPRKAQQWPSSGLTPAQPLVVPSQLAGATPGGDKPAPSSTLARTGWLIAGGLAAGAVMGLIAWFSSR